MRQKILELKIHSTRRREDVILQLCGL